MWLKCLIVALFAFAAVGCASVPEKTSKRSECTGPTCPALEKEHDSYSASESRTRRLDTIVR